MKAIPINTCDHCPHNQIHHYEYGKCYTCNFPNTSVKEEYANFWEDRQIPDSCPLPDYKPVNQ